jgi:hypothetical protein
MQQLQLQQQQQQIEEQKKQEKNKANEELRTQTSFFSTLIETATLLSQNCQRLSFIINEYYQSVLVSGS